MPSIFTLEGVAPKSFTLLGETMEVRPRTILVLGLVGLGLITGAVYGTVKVMGRAIDRQFAK